MAELKIYIIEDNISKINQMKARFEGLNEKIKKNAESVLLDFFKSMDIDSLESEEIVSSKLSEDGKYYNYRYDDNLKKVLEEILKRKEKRIFFVDLALNEVERDVFSRNSRMIVPNTAIQIVECIGGGNQKETVIFNTRIPNMLKDWKTKIRISKETAKNLKIGCIAVRTFDVTTCQENLENYLYETLSSCMEDKNE